MDAIRTWEFANGIIVLEQEFDYDLHCFEVYNGDIYLGKVVPGSLKDMESCIDALDNGEDPISAGWEDGLGNACTLEGWGEEI